MTITELTDKDRLDWLEADVSRLECVRGYICDGELDLREAIDLLAEQGDQ